MKKLFVILICLLMLLPIGRKEPLAEDEETIENITQEETIEDTNTVDNEEEDENNETQPSDSSTVKEEISEEIESNEIIRACTPLSVWRTRKLTGYLDGQGFYISRFVHSETQESGFCVEPGVNFNVCDGSYSMSVMSGNANERIGKIFHAFKKLGASDDLYVAAQLMIWDAMGYHYTLNGDAGYAYGRQMIENYISNNFKANSLELPTKYEVKIGEEVRIEDTTGYLAKRYKLSAEGIDDLRIEDNHLVFTMNDQEPKVKKIKIVPKVSFKSAITVSSLLYYSPTSQNVYSFSSSFPIEYLPHEMVITAKTGSLEVHKYDEWGNAVKERIEVEIYDENDVKVSSDGGFFIEDGILLCEGILSPGNYYLKELPTRNYVLNEEKYPFVIIEDECTYLDIFNENNSINISYSKKDKSGNDLAGAKFELFEIGNEGEEIRFLKVNEEYEYESLFDEGTVLSERYERYHQEDSFRPMEIGIVNYANNDKTGYYYVTADEHLADMHSLLGKKIFEGESLHNYIRTVDGKNHNEVLSKTIQIYKEDGSFIEEITTDSLGLYDISHYEDGNYYYLQDAERFVISKQTGINSIDNLKSDRNYLLCEKEPAEGYQYVSEACKLINTYDYEDEVHEFINDQRTIRVKVVKKSNEGLLLDNAIFDITMTFPDGHILKTQQVSGGVVVPNDGKDIIISGEEERYIISNSSSTVITDLKEGSYSYYLKGEGKGDERGFAIEKGCFSLYDIPFGTEIAIKEIKAPTGYQLDEEEKIILPSVSYDELTFELARVNHLLIIPPEYIVPLLCTRD